MDMLQQQPEVEKASVAEPANSPAQLPVDAEISNSQPLTIEEIVAKVEELSGKDAADVSRDDVSNLKQLFYTTRRRDKNESASEESAEVVEITETEDPDPLETRLKEALNIIREKKAELTRQLEAQQQKNLECKTAIVAKIREAAGDTDNVGKLFSTVKDLQEEFKQIGDVPPTDVTSIWKQYQEAVELFYDQLKINKELRDYDFRKNLEQKQLICSEAEKLNEDSDIITAFRRLQELHEKWRLVGPVAKEVREEIWNRFKEISAGINKKYQAFFEERKAREAKNEAEKTAICEELEKIDLEALSSFKAWEAATETVLALQSQWKTLGYASRKSNNLLYERYRALCDKFFAEKAAYYRSVKDSLEDNLAKKMAIVEEAEQLSSSTDFRRTSDRIVELRKQWKEIGTVPKKVSDEIWKRFNAACDLFFENKKKAGAGQRSAEQANLAAKKEIIASLRAITPETPAAEAVKTLRSAMNQWPKIGHVPFREKDKIYTEYRALVDELYEKLDMRGNAASMNRFNENLEQISGDRRAVTREREKLVRAYEARKTDLATAENNILFFTSKSSSGNSVIREMERRVERLKEDIAQLAEKIRIIDAKL